MYCGIDPKLCEDRAIVKMSHDVLRTIYKFEQVHTWCNYSDYVIMPFTKSCPVCIGTRPLPQLPNEVSVLPCMIYRKIKCGLKGREIHSAGVGAMVLTNMTVKPCP